MGPITKEAFVILFCDQVCIVLSDRLLLLETHGRLNFFMQNTHNQSSLIQEDCLQILIQRVQESHIFMSKLEMNTWLFSQILSSCMNFGITTRPCCKLQGIRTWAGVLLPYFFATAKIVTRDLDSTQNQELVNS
jgi:hypothetical protein